MTISSNGMRRAAEHLPEAGDPGRQVEAAAAPAADALVLGDRQRPRADEAHLAAQHVPELRQLVDARVPQEAADAA